jgi:hypothetical protein
MSDSAAEWVDVSELKPWTENPRRNDEAVARVAASIKRFGFGSPILARKQDGEIIAGHTRILAAKELGLQQVPVRFLDLDPVDAHLLAIADNKLSEIAEWDQDALATLMRDTTLANALDAGFGADELSKLLNIDVDDVPRLARANSSSLSWWRGVRRRD